MDLDHAQETPDQNSLKLLSDKCDELLRLLGEKEEAEATAKEKGSAYEAHRLEMGAMLQAAGIDRFEYGGRVIYLRTRTSVQVPKSSEDREAFFDYLKERGVFEQMITVHSNTLNSFYQGEYEQAVAEGNLSFKIPGIGDHNERFTLEVKNGKK